MALAPALRRAADVLCCETEKAGENLSSEQIQGCESVKSSTLSASLADALDKKTQQEEKETKTLTVVLAGIAASSTATHSGLWLFLAKSRAV